jgi:hypothetical protein
MNPSPEQIAEWRKEFELNNPQNLHYFIEGALRTRRYIDRLTQSSWAGYLRARTEQATEIAALKKELSSVYKGVKIRIPTDTMEQEFANYERRGYAKASTDMAVLKALVETLKNEARAHAMEAGSANATINEINQFISGATGEPGNWHGAQPVKKYIAEIMPLAKFGAMVLQAARDIDNSFLDVDGFDIETYAARANVVQEITVTAPCGESCACAGIVGQAGFPTLCIRTTENIEATIDKVLED